MGLARAEPEPSTSSSATLQQLQQQQHAVLRQQQEQQQRALQGLKPSGSFGEWDRASTSSSGAAAAAADSTGSGVDNMLAYGPGSTPGSTAGGTCLLPGQQGGIRALPGSHGMHWVSRADDGESAARGLLGLPRPGFGSSDQQQRGLVRSGSSGGLCPSNGEIQGVQREQAQQRQQLPGTFVGFGGSSSDAALQHDAAAAALQATPAKIGQGGLPARVGDSASSAGASGGANGSSGGCSAAAPGAAWIAGSAGLASSSSSSTVQPSSASFKRAATALAAAGEQQQQQPDSIVVDADLEVRARLERAASNAGSNPATPRAAGAVGVAGASSNPTTPSAAAGSNNSSPFLSRSFRRSGTSMRRSGSGLLRSPSNVGYPTCLICLDQLTPDDFESGEAMQLDCRCKGDVALRHRQCAEKWSRIKGNTICDVCKAPILNLPDVPPLPVPPGQGLNDDGLAGPGGDSGLWAIDEPPAVADYVFDCIRVTWVVLIVCILFFELSVSRSFLTGALMGSAYVALAASWAAAQRRRRQQRMATAAVMWVEGQMPLDQQQQEQQMPLLQGQVGGLEGLPV